MDEKLRNTTAVRPMKNFKVFRDDPFNLIESDRDTLPRGI